MKRLDALRGLDEVFGDLPLVVTCGATAREFASLGKRDSRLPLLDSMGLTSAVGLGVALGMDGPVGVIDGDGSLLMGFSILPTLATVAPSNLTVVVLDNGEHASADGMPSQAAAFALHEAVAGCGIAVSSVSDVDALRESVCDALAAPRLSVVIGEIESGNASGIGFLLDDPAVLSARFQASLAGRDVADRQAEQRDQ